LARYAQLPGVEPALAQDAAAASRQLLRDLADVVAGEDQPAADPAACAALLSLAADLPSCTSEASVSSLMTAARARLESVFDTVHGFVPQPPSAPVAPGQSVQPQPVSPLVRAMIAASWAKLLRAKVDLLPAPAEATIRAAMDAAWEALPAEQRVAMLPWLAWGEVDFAAGTGKPLAHVDDLRQMIGGLDRSRITAQSQPEAAIDLAGGLSLVTPSTPVNPRPTAQTLRPASWLPSAANDPSLTSPGSREAAWSGCLQTLRFVCQLAVSDLRGAGFRNASRATGGICASPWDVRQPQAAQALGLLAAVEALHYWPAGAGGRQTP
jgi:hypothetical protein